MSSLIAKEQWVGVVGGNEVVFGGHCDVLIKDLFFLFVVVGIVLLCSLKLEKVHFLGRSTPANSFTKKEV